MGTLASKSYTDSVGRHAALVRPGGRGVVSKLCLRDFNFGIVAFAPPALST